MSKRSVSLWIVGIVILIILSAGFAFYRASISALDEPGQFETALATKGKHIIVGHQAAKMHVTELPYSDASADTGAIVFSVECTACHGKDGRSPTHIGQSMYPRVPDLGSPEVQKWSNIELFWIVQHGIRLSGMPGFEKFNTEEQSWHLVHFIRTLPNHPKQ
ncbi:MAG TPA: cytochrome c [Candidatus Acidoferrales bacterium]|nr:cytochrome c [Candidatus Acidoferrales bacterium]